MSFDLFVLSGKQDWTPQAALDAYERLTDDPEQEGFAKPDDRITAFVAEITARWPQIDDWPDGTIDECPWSVAFDQSRGHVGSCISWSRVDEVYPGYVETAYDTACTSTTRRSITCTPRHDPVKPRAARIALA